MADNSGGNRARSGGDFADLAIMGVAGLTFALAAMFLCVAPLAGNIAGSRDFVTYWATGQQLIRHESPYDPAAMMRIERSAGLDAGYSVLYMRNPPWALPLALPLGLIGVRVGAFLWSLVLLGCWVASVWAIWRMRGRPRNRLHWIGLSFAPALVCLIVGQTALFSLLGLVLFLRFNRTRPFAAGMALWLCALKPHLFLPFGVVLLVWIAVTGSYRILAGAGVALAASCAASYWLVPGAWSEYSNLMRTQEAGREFIPCLADGLRLWLKPQSVALQYLPAAMGCVWAVAWFWPRRHGWDWKRDGGLVMLVSLFAAPYCWLYDQALAIPALLDGAYRTRSRGLIAVLALGSVPIVVALVSGVRITSGWYLLAAPAWLGWYVAAGRKALKR